MPYTPREDSFLLAEAVKKEAFGDVLDMGTGSGIQAEAAKAKAKSVTASDISKEAVAAVRKKGIKAIQS
ncbi:methyltransferase domain-containing protein, partial [Candidatus Woesearchaeota archaeon]|nr:methyltransferase domain-containing protein [Candidatus Woesearchaeota archaeon]